MRLIDADKLEDEIYSEDGAWTEYRGVFQEFINEQPTINPQDDLKAIYEMVWGFDIPSPTCPEYVEHHKQCIELMHKIKGVMKKYDND